jgi:hypothetical protein
MAAAPGLCRIGAGDFFWMTASAVFGDRQFHAGKTFGRPAEIPQIVLDLAVRE